MKLKTVLFLVLLSVLGYLAFVNNIPINVGDENTYISQDEWHKTKHASFNDDNKIGAEDPTNLIDLQDFYLFLKEMNGKAFYRHEISYLDTTGDGQKERVHSVVRLNEGTCMVRNYIEKNDLVIWEDEFLITKDLASSYIGNSDFVENYGPYALFYLGQVGNHFVEKLEKDNLFDQRKKYLLRNQSAEKSFYQRYHSPLNDKIENYTGMYLFRINDGLQHIYMWDKETTRFVCINTNNLDIS